MTNGNHIDFVVCQIMELACDLALRVLEDRPTKVGFGINGN